MDGLVVIGAVIVLLAVLAGLTIRALIYMVPTGVGASLPRHERVDEDNRASAPSGAPVGIPPVDRS